MTDCKRVSMFMFGILLISFCKHSSRAFSSMYISLACFHRWANTVPGPPQKKTRKTNNRFPQKFVRKTKTTGRQKLEVGKTKTKVRLFFSLFSFHCSNEIEREINEGHTKTKGKEINWTGRQRKSKEMKRKWTEILWKRKKTNWELKEATWKGTRLDWKRKDMLVKKNKNNAGSKVRS